MGGFQFARRNAQGVEVVAQSLPILIKGGAVRTIPQMLAGGQPQRAIFGGRPNFESRHGKFFASHTTFSHKFLSGPR